MADHLHDALTRLAADATWPVTPELAGRVRAAIDAEPVPQRRRRRRRPLLAALLALVVGGGVLAAPGVGSGLLERLGLRHASIAKVKHLPAIALGQRLRLGERTTLAAAQREAGVRLLYPAALGSPREIYADRGGVVTVLYRARSGRPILFSQIPGSARGFVQKFVTSDTQRVRIAGAPGLLLQGDHGVIFAARGGSARYEPPRLAKSTLMWERDGLLLRLEADQPLGELVRIAGSVRAR